MDWIAGLSSYHLISSQLEEQRGHMILLARTMAYYTLSAVALLPRCALHSIQYF